jgi:predicted DNA-binding transcriptional regulator AlpA
MSDHSIEVPVKRGPGRPRKAVSTTDHPAGPVVTKQEIAVIDGRKVSAMLGISMSTLRRLTENDPEFPAPFSMNGFSRHWLRSAVEHYVLGKVEASSAAKRKATAVTDDGTASSGAATHLDAS